MNALFVNYPEPACGVAQFGRNLWQILKDSNNVRWAYAEPETVGELRSISSMPTPDVVLYNWQSGQGGILNDAPFDWLRCKQALVYHDNDINDRWDAMLFADPTFTPYGKWHVIGRPLPTIKNPFHKVVDGRPHDVPWIGCNGFIGAWADQVVHRVCSEMEYALIRLNLPFAKYGDSNGDGARAMADRCRSIASGSPGIQLQIRHEFLGPDQLINWLAHNDLNCYIRPPGMNWRGISSAPDFALAAGRPIAINKCNAFRHLHRLSPSICVEDSSLMEIFSNGLSPLVAFKAKWCDPERIRDEVESVLMKLE